MRNDICIICNIWNIVTQILNIAYNTNIVKHITHIAYNANIVTHTLNITNIAYNTNITHITNIPTK